MAKAETHRAARSVRVIQRGETPDPFAFTMGDFANASDDESDGDEYRSPIEDLPLSLPPLEYVPSSAVPTRAMSAPVWSTTVMETSLSPAAVEFCVPAAGWRMGDTVNGGVKAGNDTNSDSDSDMDMEAEDVRHVSRRDRDPSPTPTAADDQARTLPDLHARYFPAAVVAPVPAPVAEQSPTVVDDWTAIAAASLTPIPVPAPPPPPKKAKAKRPRVSQALFTARVEANRLRRSATKFERARDNAYAKAAQMATKAAELEQATTDATAAFQAASKRLQAIRDANRTRAEEAQDQHNQHLASVHGGSVSPLS